MYPKAQSAQLPGGDFEATPQRITPLVKTTHSGFLLDCSTKFAQFYPSL